MGGLTHGLTILEYTYLSFQPLHTCAENPNMFCKVEDLYVI